MFCGRDFYRRLTAQSSMNSICCYDTSIFLELGEIIVEYFVYKRIFGFPPFCFFYLFMKLFLLQSITKNPVNDIPNQNFTINKLNEKNSEHSFVKKVIWEHLKPDCAAFPESVNYFLMKPSNTSIVKLVFQNKSWVTWKKMMLLDYLGGSKEVISTTRATLRVVH